MDKSNTNPNTSFLIELSSKKANYPRLILSTVDAFTRAETVQRLELACEQCRIRRAYSELGGISRLLKSNAGIYYQGLAAMAYGRGTIETAAELFSSLCGTGSSIEPRALLSLGAVAVHRGDRAEEIKLFLESLKAARLSGDLRTALEASRCIAVWKSKNGSSGLNDMEALLPLVTSVAGSYPALFYEYLNSIAVELLALDHLAEAQNLIQIVMRSPFANIYSEFGETAQDIQERIIPSNRVFLASTGLANVIKFEETSQFKNRATEVRSRERARILSFRGTGMKKTSEKSLQKDGASKHKQSQIVTKLLGPEAAESLFDRIFLAITAEEKEKLIIEFVSGRDIKDTTLDEILRVLDAR